MVENEDGMARRLWRTRWHNEGGGRELLRLAWPLVLSNSVWTLQITIDRIMLSQLEGDAGPKAVAAAMAAAMFFWAALMLFQYTANYATTFVAQYVGAERPQRVGPAVWQALYFSIVSGILFLALIPLAAPLAAWGGHSSELQSLEAIFFRCLCWSALPALITAAANSFFAGRGDSWTVLYINAAGLLVTAVLDYAWISGHWGFPAWGIAGAGWATVVGMTVSAVVALALFLRRRYREEFA